MSEDYDDLTLKIIRSLEGLGKGRIRKSGPDNMILRCPFHDDASPSFCMNIRNGLFICYGCEVTGNFRKFLELLGMSRHDIQVHYGVTLEELSKRAPPPKDRANPELVMESNRWIEEDLLGLFHHCPEKLLEEGFTEETLLHFGVGVDKHHGRITFPLRDIEGHLVGISGRAMTAAQEPRYKVYEQEYRQWGLPPYNTDKSFLLWNAHKLHTTMTAAHDRPPVVVVEGFKAAMWLHQAGFPFVVALMTKRISDTQWYILHRWWGSYYLMLDNDAAGIGGTIKVSGRMEKAGMSIRIVEYDGLQPTDVPLDVIPACIHTAETYNQIVLG